jgi:hypothetical protein
MPAGDNRQMNKDPYAELASELGNLVIAFNELEISMGGALMRILRNDDDFVGAVFVSVLGFFQKHALLKALSVKIENLQVRNELLELLDNSRRISEERNRFVHAGYTAVTGNKDQLMMVLHQRLKDFSKENLFSTASEIFKFIKPIDPDELQKLSNEATTLAFDLGQISERFYK